MTDQPVQGEGRRPLGVLVVVAVQFVRAVLVLFQILDIRLTPELSLFHIADQVPEPTPGTIAFAIARVIAVAIIVSSVAFGIGLLTGRRWGWVGAIVLSGISLAFAIGGWWDGHPAYTSMLINVIAVFYLNQRDVRAIFGELQPGDVDQP
jgi:uncharacterized membrane protein (DUF2068 family)